MGKAKKVVKKIAAVAVSTATGAFGGTIVAPGTGTVVGAGIGFATGLFIKPDDPQQKIDKNRKNELNNGGMYLQNQRRLQQQRDFQQRQMRNIHQK